MRVHDGMYGLSSGLRFFAPAALYENGLSADHATIVGLIPEGTQAPRINGRVLRIEVACPHEGILRLTVHHHSDGGSPDPGFLLPGLASLPLTASEDADRLRICGPGLEVTFGKRDWGYHFAGPDGMLCGSGADGLGIVECDDGSRYLTEKLSIGPGECIYGLGERFSPLIRNGQSIRMWNADAGTTSDLAYKNLPFYLSSAGYGVLVNTSAAVEFEVATEDVSAVRWTVPGVRMDYLLIAGTPAEQLSRLTAVTGRPPVIPRWSFGLWLTTSFTTTYNEHTIMEQVEGMERNRIPLSVFHFDCSWMRERHWCDFTWDAAAFPDPAGMLARLKARGLHVCVWINPYVSELSSLYSEGARAGHFLKRASGEVYQIDWWQPGLAFVDFTSPAACRWFREKLQALIAMGVDTFKTDFGESAPLDAVYHDGSSGALMHNRYALLFNKTVFDLLEEARGSGEAIVFARSATVGSQRYPLHWGGDSSSTYSSMAAQLRAGLSFAVSGCAFWSHDIGGFYGRPTPDLYMRWVAFGLLSSHSRLHGNDVLRVPWLYGEEAVSVLRHFTEWRHRLIPYLFDHALEASRTGLPLMRPMVLAYPADPACRLLDQQYMLGDRILVAPVFREDGRADYYLPDGDWYHLFSGQRQEGGRWHQGAWDFLSLPVYVKANSILPLGPVAGATSSSDFRGLALTVFGLATEARFSLHNGREELSGTLRRQGHAVVLTLSQRVEAARLVLIGESAGRIECPAEGERTEVNLS